MKTAGLIVVQETIIDALNQEDQTSKGEKVAVSESYVQAHSQKVNLLRPISELSLHVNYFVIFESHPESVWQFPQMIYDFTVSA